MLETPVKTNVPYGVKTEGENRLYRDNQQITSYFDGTIAVGKTDSQGGTYAHSKRKSVVSGIFGRRRMYSLEKGSKKLSSVSAQSNTPYLIPQYVFSDIESHSRVVGKSRGYRKNYESRSDRPKSFTNDGNQSAWQQAMFSFYANDRALSDNQAIGSASAIGFYGSQNQSGEEKSTVCFSGLSNPRSTCLHQKKQASQRLHANGPRGFGSRYSPNQGGSFGGRRNVDPLVTRTTPRNRKNIGVASLGQVSRNDASSEVTTQTGNNGKNLEGLAAAISTTPSSGVYGGIDSAQWAFWRNGVVSGGTPTALTIQQQMTSLAIRLRRMQDHTDLILADNNFWTLYNSSLQAIQRVNSMDGDDKAGSGFPGLMFFGAGARATVEIANGAFTQSPANRMWFLNTNYIHWRPHAKRNFVSLPKRESINQDALTSGATIH